MSHHHHKTRQLGLKVLVFDLDTNEQIREITVRHFDSDKRKWLTDLVVWASLNHKSIEILSLQDDAREYESTE